MCGGLIACSVVLFTVAQRPSSGKGKAKKDGSSDVHDGRVCTVCIYLYVLYVYTCMYCMYIPVCTVCMMCARVPLDAGVFVLYVIQLGNCEALITDLGGSRNSVSCGLISTIMIFCNLQL